MVRQGKITLLVLLLSLAACTKDGAVSNCSGVKAMFFASVSEASTKTPIDVGESIPTGGKVGIFALSYTGENETSVVWPTAQGNFSAYNIQGLLFPGTPSTIKISPDYYYTEGQKVAFYSYYPKVESPIFNSGSVPTIDIKIPYSPLDQEDYMWATPMTGTSISPTVNFTYNHALSLVRIKVMKTFSETASLKSVSITTAEKQRATMRVTTGEMATTNVAGGETFFYIGNLSSAIPSNTPLQVSNGKFLLIPGSTITSIKLTLRLEGEMIDREYVISNPSIALTKGSALSAVVNLSKKSASVAIWEDLYENDKVGSTAAPANCYIVSPGGSITIPVNIKGNGDYESAALGGISVFHTAISMGKIWETVDGLVTISDFNISAQTVTVNASSSSGNAVIAAYDTDGTTILWSWHIWVTPTPAIEQFNGYVWMDRNLGAIVVANNTSDADYTKCSGLCYQWGRKDPFPGPTAASNSSTPLTIYNFTMPAYTGLTTTTADTYVKSADASAAPISYTSQLAYSIKNPMLFLLNWAGSTATAAAAYTAVGGKDSWAGEYGETKSIYDPCPSGWRVPSGKRLGSTYIAPWINTQLGTRYSYNYHYSAVLLANTDTRIKIKYYYPIAGCRLSTSGSLTSVGSSGYLWSASSSSNVGNGFSINYDNVNTAYTVSRASGSNIRCVW